MSREFSLSADTLYYTIPFSEKAGRELIIFIPFSLE
jgi:hypothetical protein